MWLMTQQLLCDVNEADEAEQRRLERHPAPEVLARLPPAAHLLSLKYFSKYGAYTLYTGLRLYFKVK